jgi:hypothetical protein
LSAVAETLGVLKDIAGKIESDWRSSELAEVQEEDDICE